MGREGKGGCLQRKTSYILMMSNKSNPCTLTVKESRIIHFTLLKAPQ